MSFFKRIAEIYKGKSIARIMLNESFIGVKLSGDVLDVGGARNPDYFKYFDVSDMSSSQIIDGKTHKIDFEKDLLPFDPESFDTVICANVLEHIYNHKLLVGSIFDVIKKGGSLVGFVPFLIQYHPDPHDYFRYTKEALKKIFIDSGFTDVTIVIVGKGPAMVNFNNIMFMLPRILRVVAFGFYYVLSLLTTHLKPELKDRYPLGFTFICKK
jgi:SAM-dependent methyltransferase